MPAEMQYTQGLSVTSTRGDSREAQETMPVQPETGLVMAIHYIQFGFSRLNPANPGNAHLVASMAGSSIVDTTLVVADPANVPLFLADMEVEKSHDTNGVVLTQSVQRLQHYFDPPLLWAGPKLFLAAIYLEGADDQEIVLSGVRYSMTRISREDAVLLSRRQGELGRGD